jgi:hypothetical protein
MTVAASSYQSVLSVTETITDGVPDAASPNINHTGFNSNQRLNPSSTPPATLVASFVATLVAGALTIDLTNMSGVNGATVNGNTLKVRMIKFQAPAGNGATITAKVGVTNGYQLRGAGWQEAFAPGQESLCYLADGAPAIGGSAKTIDLAGTGTDSLNVIVLLG